MEKSKEDMTFSELMDREKKIREEEARQGFDYSYQKKLPDENYRENKSVNSATSMYNHQFPNKVCYVNNNMQMKPIASRNDINMNFNSKSQVPNHHLQNFNPQIQPQQQRQKQSQINPSLRGEFYIKSEKMDLKNDNKQLDLERINQMSHLEREMRINPIVYYNNQVAINGESRNVNIKTNMNQIFDFPKPEYNTRKTYYDDNNYAFNDPLNSTIRKNNYQINQQTQEQQSIQQKSQQQQIYQQKQQFNHYHQKHLQNNQNCQNNGFAFNREPISKNVINQVLQGNFLENPQRMSFQPKNNHQHEMNQRLESRYPSSRNISFPTNNQNQNNQNQNNQNNHTGINPNYQPSIFMSLPVNTRDDI